MNPYQCIKLRLLNENENPVKVILGSKYELYQHSLGLLYSPKSVFILDITKEKTSKCNKCGMLIG